MKTNSFDKVKNFINYTLAILEIYPYLESHDLKIGLNNFYCKNFHHLFFFIGIFSHNFQGSSQK